MRPFMLFALLLCVGCASKGPMPAPPAQAQNQTQTQSSTNPFQQYYVQRMKPPAGKPAPEPSIYRGQDQESDNRHLLEDGYDLIGHAAFEAGDVPPEQALQQAQNVHADIVIVYTRRTGTVTLNVQRQAQPGADDGEFVPQSPPAEAMPKPQAPHYEHIASYWSKLPPPVLGLHVQSTSKYALSGGVPVVAVVKDSPAATAEVQAGDLVLRLGEADISDAEALEQATRRYADKEVEIVFARKAETLHKTVVLNNWHD
jgi:predicted small lipoprotein YifL